MFAISKTKTVIWPKPKSLDVYYDKKADNTISFDINLWQPQREPDLESVRNYFHKHHVSAAEVLIPDNVVLTKSFIYDSKITSIEKREVISLAESFVPFKIDPGSIDYNLVPADKKTIIQARIFDKQKVDTLLHNLALAGLTTKSLVPCSAAIANTVSRFYQKEYFLIFPISANESILMLAKAESVYLTANFKGKSFDIQKIVNYSDLYFTDPVTKLFIPAASKADISFNSKLERTEYDQTQIAYGMGKAGNYPMPVLGLFISSIAKPSNLADIIDTKMPQPTTPTPQKTSKNPLPLIAAFVLTAALASVGIWFVFNREGSDQLESPTDLANSSTPTTTQSAPTQIPTPTVAQLSKTTKIQVLNATNINGLAATFKSTLNDLGFKDVAVGNSPEDLTVNEVQYKASNPAVASYFQHNLINLKANFKPVLEETSKYDVIFLLGTDVRDVTPAPTSSAAATSTATPSTSPTSTQ